MSRRWYALAVVALLPLMMAHGDGCGCGDASIELGPPTGATCPPGSTLTYASFGQQFMESYCTSCHASTLTGEARQGAPEFHDFDTIGGIRNVAGHIDQMAGSGPNATNTGMPNEDPAPTMAERQQLAEWIACGAP